MARADLDADAKKPYQLQIVLHIGANRVFTPLFQEQLQRDVQNQLKIAFGDLAQVEVTRSHRLLGDIESKGLDAALEGFDALSDRTTFFVLLDYVAGTYQVQTRFHDGNTGQAGALTSRLRINDRAAVAASLAQAIEASFSPVGVVTAAGQDATLKLRGGELGVPLDRWVKPGQVFAVSRISEQGGRRQAARLEWALLEVAEPPVKGVCRCRYRHRYQEDTLTESPGVLGYRALRLPTVTGPLKLQLLDDAAQPLDGVRVRVRQTADAKPEELITNRDGLATTRANYAHLALVQVLSGDAVRAQFPVELIEGRTVVARVKIQTDRESLAPLEVRRDAWLRRVYENVRMSSERTLDLSGQLNQSLQAALESGRKSLPALEEEIKYLDREADDLNRLAREKKLAYDLREGRQQIDELRKKAKELQAFVARLDAVLKDAGSDEKTLGLAKRVERAQLLEAEAEFEQAIRLYDQVVQASPEQAKIKAHLDRLRKQWETKDDPHKEARKFLYETWPTLDVAGLQANMKQAEEALAACRAAGDKLTPQKLMRANVAHKVSLQKQLETLKRRDNEDSRNKAKAITQVSERLLRLHTEAAAFVGARKD
jgi:hypothetical protein